MAPVPTPNAAGHVYLRMSETTEGLVVLRLSSSFVQCGHSTCGCLWSEPVVRKGEKSLRQGFHRYKNPEIS